MVRISVITATYQPGAQLAECIHSVRENHAFEHRIADNCSTDRATREILLDAAADATVVSEPDRGIYDAMNKGLRAASGDVLACLNADDSYLPGSLDLVRRAFEAHPEAGIVHGSIVVRGKIHDPAQGVASFGGARIFHPACFVRREVFEKIGYFDLRYPICADLDFFLRAKEAGVVFYRVAAPRTVFAPGGVSTTRRKEAAREVRAILIAHGRGRIFAWGFYALARLRALAARILKKGKSC